MWERDTKGEHTALGFSGSYTGNSIALNQFAAPDMSLSGLGWPSVEYPDSAAAEAQVLESVRDSLRLKKEAGEPVAAIVIEPTNWQTGHVASESFIASLRSLASEFESALVVDETNTGCGATGEGFW